MAETIEEAAGRPGSNEWWTVRRVANGDARRPWYELADGDRALLSDRDKLAAEVERIQTERDDYAAIFGQESEYRQAAEAKLSALSEAVAPFVKIAGWLEPYWADGLVIVTIGHVKFKAGHFRALASLDRTVPAEGGTPGSRLMEATREHLAALPAEGGGKAEWQPHQTVPQTVHPPSWEPQDARRERPEPPWPPGAANNAKREGWKARYAAKPIAASPFPQILRDLEEDFRVGWNEADRAILNSEGAGS